ncbi:hypothetical protein Z950_1427 [Sulfitobacter mediterraneus KCTC 32188]|nr:hypothetical protein Z950_1427 [Sulfitobacter mediterraneus KCTC 32188]
MVSGAVSGMGQILEMEQFVLPHVMSLNGDPQPGLNRS